MVNQFRPAEAVVFDVDGVLIDSLPQHLQICRDKAAEFGLALRIPTVGQFRQMVAAGVKISPMFDFFLAVGFPPAYAQKATADYDRDFARRYRPPLFSGVEEMLARLRGAGLHLGLVTSNRRANVLPVLGRLQDYFDSAGLFFYDSDPVHRPKSWYLAQCALALDRAPDACVYVGDQPADLAAARDAGFQFLGVSYGWGLSEDGHEFATASRVQDIARGILAPQRAVLPLKA